MRQQAQEILSERLGVEIGDVRNSAADLSGGQQQLVALARAEAWDCKVLLLDEPTAALSRRAAERVNDVIRRMRDKGVTVLIVSHDLPSLLEIADEITVLRLGRTVGTIAASDVTSRDLVAYMTGAMAIGQKKEEHKGVEL